jgi:hypothetical protein
LASPLFFCFPVRIPSCRLTQRSQQRTQTERQTDSQTGRDKRKKLQCSLIFFVALKKKKQELSLCVCARPPCFSHSSYSQFLFCCSCFARLLCLSPSVTTKHPSLSLTFLHLFLSPPSFSSRLCTYCVTLQLFFLFLKHLLHFLPFSFWSFLRVKYKRTFFFLFLT